MMTRKRFIKKLDKRMKQSSDRRALALEGWSSDCNVDEQERKKARKEYHFWNSMWMAYNMMRIEATVGRWKNRMFITNEDVWDYQEWYLNYLYDLWEDTPV